MSRQQRRRGDVRIGPGARKREQKAAPPTPAPPQAAMKASKILATPPDDKAILDELLTKLEEDRGHPVIVYWMTRLARMSLGAVPTLFDHLMAIGRQKELSIVLNTPGGDTVAPWRLISLIREFADHLTVFVPRLATSSGTLFTMGADEIVMTPLSALGPIDPSRSHPLLPKPAGAEKPEPISVQDMRHAMQFIREAMDSGGESVISPEAMAQIFTALFDKVHPLAIGAIEQSYALAKLIGTRCLSTHMDDDAKIKKIVDRLCDEFKAHDYQIGRREAEGLGLKVREATPVEEAILLDLLKFYEARPTGPFGTALKPGQDVSLQVAWLDSSRLKTRVMADRTVGPQLEVQGTGDQWVSY